MTIINIYFIITAFVFVWYVSREFIEQKKIGILDICVGFFLALFWPLIGLLLLYCLFEEVYFKWMDKQNQI